MAVGEGKYDKSLTLALEFSYAQEGILIVFDGNKGMGFSVQATEENIAKIPDVLEHMAKEIRKDLNGLS